MSAGNELASLWQPDRLVTLMELLEASAEAFWRLSGLVGQMIVRLEAPAYTEAMLKAAISSLGELNRETERLGLTSATKQLERIKEHLFERQEPVGELRMMVRELHQRILDELDGRTLLIVRPERRDLYEQKARPFGDEVDVKFPSASYDIAEAAKCLALGRSTACVTHLMRALEVGLSVVATQFHVDSSHTNWNKIIEQLESKIRGISSATHGPGWKEDEKFYSGAATHFRFLKNGWRNHAMHVREKYTDQEAAEIFGSVRAFLRHLATRLSE